MPGIQITLSSSAQSLGHPSSRPELHFPSWPFVPWSVRQANRTEVLKPLTVGGLGSVGSLGWVPDSGTVPQQDSLTYGLRPLEVSVLSNNFMFTLDSEGINVSP